jgi:putative transposase
MTKKKVLTEKPSPNSSIRYEIYPSTSQLNILKKWFGCRRWVYNRCLSLWNNNKSLTLKDLRTQVINNVNFETENSWMLDYEYDLRDEAIRDLFKNIKSNKAKGSPFKLKYISKKSNKESISVLSKKWNKERNFYSRIFKPSELVCKEKIPDILIYDSRLSKNPTGKYYLHMPRKLDSENQTIKPRCIFIDPGVTPILTGYDPEGKIYKIGGKDMSRIYRLNHYLNKIRSKRDKCKNSKKKKLYTKAMHRMSYRIDNIILDFHNKITKWLCLNFTHVFIPKLNFHKMKNLNKKSKKVLMTLKHCSLVDMLKSKSGRYSTNIIEVNESYTSKTCSVCGEQNNNLGRSKIYRCPNKNCCKIIDRDINGAINIMLRYFTKRVMLEVLPLNDVAA